MKLKTQILSIILLLLSFPLILFGQSNKTDNQKILWRLRADTITANLLRESPKLGEMERSLLFAKLGDLWWKFDPVQSNIWFEKSVDTVFFCPADDIKKERKEYFDTSRKLLILISDHNPKQSNRLVKIISENDKLSDEEKQSNADSLIKYALQIVKKNPGQAAQIGIAAFRSGSPKEFYKLIWELRRGSSTLADQLLKTAFSAAKISPDYNLLQGIQLAVLPESSIDNFPANLSASPSQKVEVLNFFADYLFQLSFNVKAKTAQNCGAEALLINRSRKFYDSLLPQKAGIVQQAIDFCLDKNTQNAATNVEKPSKELSIEELLSLADENKDNPLVRLGYLNKAIILAGNRKEYAVVIKIVNSLTAEEIAENPEFWEEMRYDAAGNLAYQQYKAGDFQGALKTLQDIAAPYRPFAQIVFVIQFPLEDTSAESFLIGVLNDARAGFLKSEKPFAQKSAYWFLLIKFYSDHKQPNDASEVYREIVKSYNDSLKPENGQTQIDSESVGRVFSPTLIESQENSLFETTNLIGESKSRLSVNLVLLKITLQKYRTLNEMPANAKTVD